MAAKNEWATKICAAWQKSVAAIFDVGDLLVAARNAQPHGTFERMIEHELPFGPRTAQCLMAVAADARLRKANHGSLLPPSWRTLYEISKMTDEEFTVAVANGLVRPEVTRTEILARNDLPADYSPSRREYKIDRENRTAVHVGYVLAGRERRVLRCFICTYACTWDR